MKPHQKLRWLLPLALVGGACTSILGIEDIHPGAKPGSGEGGEGASGGTGGGKGGASGTSGASSGASGASSGASGKGGASGASGASGQGGTAGDTGGAGGAGDMGGDGGTGGTTDPTVHGKVVTHLLQPIPNVIVHIGAADATTDSDGEFEILDVAPQYDATFTVTFEGSGGRNVYGWAYLGLTRRDPTLMVYDGLTNRSGSLHMTFGNITPLGSTRNLTVSLGSPDGDYEYDGITSLPDYQPSSYWMGPATSTATGHGLVWEMNANDLPTAYRAYDTQLVPLAETGTGNLTFDLVDAPQPISSMNVSGTVTSSSSEGRENKVLARFTDHASITLVDHYGTSLTDDFTYLAPNLTNGSITVIGIEEGSSGLALAHKDNLAPGQSGIAIDIPDPPVLTAPSAGTVTPSTQFRWASSFSGFVLHIEDEDLYQGIYVVTSSKQVTLPVFEDGFALRADAPHWWEVQTHGDPASVDDMAGPHGFADAHGYYRNTNASPPRDGSFTVSLSRGFNTAP